METKAPLFLIMHIRSRQHQSQWHTLHEELYHQILIMVDEPDWSGKGGRISGVFELRQREKGSGFAPGGVVCSHLAGILSEPQAGSKVFLF